MVRWQPLKFETRVFGQFTTTGRVPRHEIPEDTEKVKAGHTIRNSA